MKKQTCAGFSLLELILAIGIMAILLPSAWALFHAQTVAQREHRASIQQIDIINDFHTFIQVQSFSDIKRISERNSPLYVIENEQDGIISREFVAKDEWLGVDEANKEYYAITVDRIGDLFDDDKIGACACIPLMCKLSKLTAGDKQIECAAFVTVKNY